MTLSSLIFRDKFKIHSEYDRMVSFFKTGLNDLYYKGYIDKDETQLFYSSGFFRPILNPVIPVMQLNFKNKADKHGQFEIQLKMVDFVVVLFAIANLSIIIAAIYSDKVSWITGLLFPVFSYLFLLVSYSLELRNFKKDIEPLMWRKD